MPQPALEGACLCGAVTLSVGRVPRQLTQCNCSACRRYGTLWAYYRRAAVTISAPRGGLARYRRGTRRLSFVWCQTCGCVIQWDTRRRGPDEHIGVNMRLFDPARMADVPVRILDGDRTWRTLVTYTQPALWISPRRAAAAEVTPTPAPARAATRATPAGRAAARARAARAPRPGTARPRSPTPRGRTRRR